MPTTAHACSGLRAWSRPVKTIRVPGEALVEHFGPERFDIACATDSLDHSADPLAIIRNMAGVVRSGGTVMLRHGRNEGEKRRYEGLHLPHGRGAGCAARLPL